MYPILALISTLLSQANGQQVGTLQAENHPSLTWQNCAKGGSCSTVNGKVVIDANWRWLHSTSGSTNCYTGNTWDKTLCPNDATCAQNCAVEGADYSGTYGITTSGNTLNLNFITNGAYAKNVGSRTYLMASDTQYQQFKLLNREFTFDVDLSALPCGLNGALYFVNMDADGGMAKYSTNKAGAKYGTGYCDSQCPRDLKFINGQANVEGWQPASGDANSGVGNYGSCCPELDVWEANSISTAYTPHPCGSTLTQTRCSGDSGCGGTYSGTRYGQYCDPDGCDFNSYRQGNTSFYGPGKTINTSSKLTVVTQFLTSDNTDNGQLSQIKRFYVQNGKVFANSQSDIPGVAGNSITTAFCNAQKTAFGDTNQFNTRGGLAAMGNAMKNGMTLVMSVWDDHYAKMLWLDSNYPTDKSASTPGVARGTCATSSGEPAQVEGSTSTKVAYGNIKFGPIGSTFSQPAGT
ncbi:MAG: hypothetical protein Q9160_008534 [Pyrenula sp. 1 TL-2023]